MGAHPCREPISAQGPFILSAHGTLSMTRVQPCPGLNHPEVPWGAFHVQGLSMPSDRFPGPIPAKGPSCSGLIHAEDLRRPIHTQYPSILRALPSPGTINPKGPCWPIHSEGPSLPRVNPSRGHMGAHPCRGPSLPSANPSQEPSLPRTHPSRGPMGQSIPRNHGGPTMPMARPCPAPIHPEFPWGPSMLRAHPYRGEILAQGSFHPEGL